MAFRARDAPRNGRRGATGLPTRRSQAEYEAMRAAKQEMERREHVLESRHRIDAKWRPKIPDVRKVANFEAFKNHFQDLDEPDYAVEVLYAAPNLQAQIRHEQTDRRKEDLARTREKWATYSYEFGGTESGLAPSSLPRVKKTAREDKARNDNKSAATASQLQDSYIQRIRIQ